MKKGLVLLATCIFLFLIASNSMAWTLVYAHDENGNATFGDIQSLIDAVNHGKSIRFSKSRAGYDGVPVTTVMDAEYVLIKNNVV